MASGLVAHWDELEFAVSFTSTDVLTGANADTILSAGIRTRHGLVYLSPTTLGLEVAVQSHVNRTGGPTPTGHSYEFRIPDAGILSTSTGATHRTSMAASVTLTGVKLYSLATGGWRLDFSWEFYVEAALFASGGPTTLTSDWFCPAGTPVLGLPPELSCLASQDPSPIRYVPTVFDPLVNREHTVTVSASGGWRFLPNGSASYIDLALSLPALPAWAACPVTPPDPSYSAPTMFAATASSYFYHREDASASQARRTVQTNAVSVFLCPVHDRAIARIAPGYRALWYRAAIPYARATSSRECIDYAPPVGDPFDPPGPGSVATSESEVSQHWSEFLEEVGDSVGVIEAPFTADVRTPVTLSGVSYDILNKPTFVAGRYWKSFEGTRSYPKSFDDPDTAALVAYLQPVASETHKDLVSWMNQVASPHWLLFFWYPDQAGAGHQWTVDGANELPEDYWLPWRGQWLSHPSLPGGGSKKRTNVLAEGLYHSALSPVVNNRYFGNCESGWVGVRRFRRNDYTVPTSYAYTSASSSLWSGTNCTLAFGAGAVTATAAAAGACTVDLSLRSFTVEPFLFPQIVRGFVADWTLGGGATGGAAYLVSVDGSEVLLSSTASTTEVRRPLGSDSKYVGSWRQDFGQGAVTDQGSDLLASGDSNAAFNGTDPARAQHYMLLAGRGARYLRFKFTAAAAGDTMAVNYPVIYPP